MCGVIGLCSMNHRNDLGIVAAELLKTLEYRGYDSTGAAFQGEGEEIVLRKGVGAPSVMVEQLGIIGCAGSIMCGQVRWATFGSVDDLNAQPHEVRCKTHIYGAHNGNVTNCDDLKTWLTSEGHQVLSDNDGEMVVHTVEHYFAAELARGGVKSGGHEWRRSAMRAAILTAGTRLHGSYAAVIVDPVSRTLWAIKQGSSLYFGFGRAESGGEFAIASSDLSSVLKLTRVLVPMAEGEFMEYTPESRQLYAMRDQGTLRAGDPIDRQPTRSRLQAKDAALLPQFESFMEQEIAAQEDTCRRIQALFSGGSEASVRLAKYFETWPADERRALDGALQKLRDEYDDDRIRERFYSLMEHPAWMRAIAAIPDAIRLEMTDAPLPQLVERLVSLESGLLADLFAMARSRDELFAVRLLDVLFEKDESAEFLEAAGSFIDACRASLERGGRVFFVCCGSSYHAALAGSVFFNELARSEIIPVLPGEFRGRFASSLRRDDLVVAVSQSGETKDLIDVMNHVIATGLPIRRVAIVNNVSSTLGQEKCDTVLPLRCGPEIAVPATKSYMNQIAMMYSLAIELGKARVDRLDLTPEGKRALAAELDDRFARLGDLPRLIRETLVSTEHAVEDAAALLYLEPSMHILATRLLAIAKEGALKIREVVLNHTEGFEASEFKHGPNTILGVNTVFGIGEVIRFSKALSRQIDDALRIAQENALPAASGRKLAQALADAALAVPTTPFSLRGEEKRIFERISAHSEILRELYEDYPLIFVTGPDETDVNLTVSQVNTHKIRGAMCVMVAEENPALRQAVTKPPTDNPRYRSVYIALPRTNDNLMVVFSATVVLQRLALRMSLLKQEYLERLGFRDHGVHPDVPKNVSKSITVD
jgi:glucosamine 6-phosphate synthetase-like amidotransferase/phosphosugar isomerase protein